MAILILLAHFVWIGFVIFGALWTRGRPVRTVAHVLTLLWGIVVELSPWPCPLTLAENYFELKAGTQAYRGSCLLHWLDAIVYPNLPNWALTAAGVAVCALNLAIYARRLRSFIHRSKTSI
jgi:hypothetical protein